MDSLKGLAHPLRVQLLDTLSVHGAATASGLAERLGESSGATSYHLRQLAKHGFVREVEGRGTGRERWWERMPGAIQLASPEFSRSESTKAAQDLVVAEWERQRTRMLHEYMTMGVAELPDRWLQASTIATVNVRVTVEQLADISAAWKRFATQVLDPYRSQEGPGTRPVQIHFNAFPVLDGVETPRDDDNEFPGEHA